MKYEIVEIEITDYTWHKVTWYRVREYITESLYFEHIGSLFLTKNEAQKYIDKLGRQCKIAS